MAGFRYLLDTNILSDLLRNPGGRAARRLALVGEAMACTSIVVACELRYGARKKGSPQLSERVEAILGSLEWRRREVERPCGAGFEQPGVSTPG